MKGEPKRSISQLFVSAMNQLETGGMSLDEFNQLVDLTGKAVPGDDQQKAFYAAIKSLADTTAITCNNDVVC